MLPPEILGVYCLDTYDPPLIYIVIAGQVPLTVSTGVYELIKDPLGLPDNPCAGVGDD